MRPLYVSLATLLALTGGLRPQTAPAEWTVYLRRAGPIPIGMRLPEVRNLLHDPKAYLAYVDVEPDNSPCAYLESKMLPDFLAFLFQYGKVVRIDVLKPGIRTASGVQVGDSEDTVKSRYPGRIHVGPHPYLPEPGHYLNFVPVDPSDKGYGMVFETDKGRVTSYRAGTKAAVALKEGCS